MPRNQYFVNEANSTTADNFLSIPAAKSLPCTFKLIEFSDEIEDLRGDFESVGEDHYTR